MRMAIAKASIAGLAGLWFVALLAGPAMAREATLPAFQISRDGVPAGYLVGTMHSEDPRVMALMRDLELLVEQVDVVAIELVPDGITLLAVGAATLLPADQRLSERIGAQRFAALREAAAAHGLPESVLERLKPWAAAVILGVPAMETGQVLDTALYLAAQARTRQVVGLETAAEQIAVFDRMPGPLQTQLLDAMIKTAPQMPMHLEALTAAYLSGDLDRIDAVARAQHAGVPPAVRTWFESELLQRRNARMLERALRLLAKERVLIAVGAMHLGGDHGLIDGLRRRGFAITPLSRG